MRDVLNYRKLLQEFTLPTLLMVMILALLLSSSSFADVATPASLMTVETYEANVSDGEGAVLITWTAPGDDGDEGTASYYDLRYRSDGEPMTNDSTFALGIAIPLGAPLPSGTLEEYVIELPAGVYSFAIKTADEVFNWSEISNNPVKNIGVLPPQYVHFIVP